MPTDSLHGEPNGYVAPSNGPATVLFVTHSAEWIGPNASLLELVIRLPRDLKPIVVMPGTGPFSEALAQRGIRPLSLNRLDKYGVPALIRAVRREGASVVYGNSANSASRNALVAAKFTGVPFVYHLREMARGGWHGKIRLFGWADAAIAVSEATAASYGGSFRAVPRVIHNGVSVDRFELDRSECRREVAAELGIPPSAPILVQVGNLNARKGQLTAVLAHARLIERFPDCRLIIVGRLDRDPSYVQKLRMTIREHGLDERVVLPGLRADVPRLLAASDLLLHTATEDPHPRAVIEAMAAGLPVVAIAVDGVKETVVDGETGFLLAFPGDPSTIATRVADLLGSPTQRQAMGKSGLMRVRRHFSADRTARQVVDVIRNLIGASGDHSE